MIEYMRIAYRIGRRIEHRIKDRRIAHRIEHRRIALIIIYRKPKGIL